MNIFIRLRPLRIAAALGFMVAAAPMAVDVALAQNVPPEEVVLATVDGDPITQADLEAAAPDFAEDLNRMPPQDRTGWLLGVLIDTKITAKAAQSEGLEKDPKVARRIAAIRERALRGEYLRAKVLAAITEETVKKRFDEQAAKFVAGDEVHARHILVESEDEAKAIIAELDKGGDFAAIAKEKSKDPGSGANGGDLGFFGHGTMVKPFEDEAFALKVGAYSKVPVKSDFGWHVLKVEEMRKQAAPTFAAEAPRLRDEMLREFLTAEMKRLRDGAKVEIVEPKAAPAPETTPATPPAQ